jgi:two-component system response regulator YesN
MEKIRILVVDDYPMMARAWAKALTNSGRYEATTAMNGREGLERLRENPVDIVLTDNNMPVMDGPEFVRLAKQDFPKLPFILTGAEAIGVDLAVIAQECGAAAYLPKPVDFEELERTIQALVHTKKGGL